MRALQDATSPAYTERLEEVTGLARELLSTAGMYPDGGEAVEAVEALLRELTRTLSTK
jgi:hypothetical protein